MRGDLTSLWKFVAAVAALLSVGASAPHLGPDSPNHLSETQPALVAHYGSDPLEIGELRLPEGKGPFPVAVVIHGGCWTKGFAQMRHTAALASALTAAGIATWNVEYRQVGDPGGGWPGTFEDWGAATDYLRTLAKQYPLDLSRVVVTGHSAGAHAALFVASRARLPAKSVIRGTNPLPIHAVVAIDGPGDIAAIIGPAAKICGKHAIEQLMGGSPAAVPDRYAQGSPRSLLPLGVRQVLVSASPVLTPQAAEAYREAATAAGDKVDVRILGDSGHFEPISPGTSEERDVQNLIIEFSDLRTKR